MYRGFNLEIEKEKGLFFATKYLKKGSEIFNESKNIRNKLNSYMGEDGILNAKLIEKDWFSTDENYHVFISHSHKDEDLAIFLAGYLNEKYGLNSFIDSAVWGYSEDLLKNIDNRYCLFEEEKTSYSYSKRNKSTAHIHNILLMALAKMIDKTECLIFLNTPESVPITNVINDDNYTFSPWIYSEIKISEIIRKGKSKNRPIFRFNEKKTFAQDCSSDELIIKYSIGKKHLVDINLDDISNLSTNKNNPWITLDNLYEKTREICLKQINNDSNEIG